MDEQRRVAAFERLEHRAETLEAGRAAERVGRDAGAGEPPVEQPRERRRVGLGEADRGPGAERGRQLGDAVVVGGEQRLGLGGGERLDARAGRRGHQRAVEAVGAHERRAPLGVVVGEVERRLRLAAQAQRPAVGAAHEPRRLAAPDSSRSSGSGHRCWWMSIADSRRR